MSVSPVSATTTEPSHVAPAHPDQPGVPFAPIADDAFDPDLERIAFERDRVGERALAGVRMFSIAVAGLLAFALRNDLRYALGPSSPIELSPRATAAELDAASHHHVAMKGIPGGVGAVDYRRPLQSGTYRLAPLVDRPDVYAELRLPDGVDPRRFVPPTFIEGRLVPLDAGGVRFGDARALIEGSTGKPAPAPAYLIEVGARPTVRNPAVALGALALLVCAAQGAALLAQLRRKAPAAS